MSEQSPAIVVLVVEDHEDTRTSLAEQLVSAGMIPLTAATAADAREVLAREHVDIIVSDVSLGGESGIQMMVDIRKDGAHRDIPAIAATGTHRRDDVEDEHPALFQAVMEKPYAPEELIRTIRTILSRH